MSHQYFNLNFPTSPPYFTNIKQHPFYGPQQQQFLQQQQQQMLPLQPPQQQVLSLQPQQRKENNSTDSQKQERDETINVRRYLTSNGTYVLQELLDKNNKIADNLR